MHSIVAFDLTQAAGATEASEGPRLRTWVRSVINTRAGGPCIASFHVVWRRLRKQQSGHPSGLGSGRRCEPAVPGVSAVGERAATEQHQCRRGSSRATRWWRRQQQRWWLWRQRRQQQLSRGPAVLRSQCWSVGWFQILSHDGSPQLRA